MNRAHVVILLVIASVAFADHNPSLATVLTSDGRIVEGASGSFDPDGFCMNYGPDGEPLFVEDGSLPCEPVPWPDGQDLEGAWYTLGTGVNGQVQANAVSGSDVYVGGEFTQAGGSPAIHIARWDGSSWHPLGSGVEVPYGSCVRAIAVSGSDVYVGGYFTEAGGSPANNIARWDGSSWHPLGSGLSGTTYPYVYAIAISGSDVYVGGYFTQAGGSPANNIARWNGSSWSAMGSGVNDYVYAIAVSGSDVYVGGEFTQAGGSPANYIARWDGSSWHPLGSGVNGWGYYVKAIAVSGSDVYVGGYFTEAGGSPANYIARWDGSSWHPLGSGLSNSVYAIALSGSDVYVGGYFGEAGGNPADHIARWRDPDVGIDATPEVITGILHTSPNPTASGIELSFQSIGLSPLTLEIYDAAGRLVRTQDLGTLPAGSQAHYWDGLDGNGHALAQGVYFLRLASDEFETSTRVVLLR